jgi:hypothetical protein
MQYVNEPFRQRAVGVISTLVLSAAQGTYYEIFQGDDQPQMEISPIQETQTFLSAFVEPYFSSPTAAEIRRRNINFGLYMSEWRQIRNPLSSNSWDNVLNPGYQKIIGMGSDALPLILRELEREFESGEPDDWFIALWAVTGGENPVPLESRGKTREMAKAWLDWGSCQGYLYCKELGAVISESGQMDRA